MLPFPHLVVLQVEEFMDRIRYRDLTPKAVEREAFRVVAAHADPWGGGHIKFHEHVAVRVDPETYDMREALLQDPELASSIARKITARLISRFRPKKAPQIRIHFMADDSVPEGQFRVTVSYKRPMAPPRFDDNVKDPTVMDPDRSWEHVTVEAEDQPGRTRLFAPTKTMTGPIGGTRVLGADGEAGTPAELPTLWLVPRTSNGAKPIRLTSDPLVIGYDQHGDGNVPDEFVSGEHLRAWVEGDTAKVEDLGSTNGTTVNATRVTTSVVKVGDIVKVGVTAYVLSATREADSTLSSAN